MKSENAPPRQTGEKTQDKEIAYALHSSGNCHEDPLHRNGYQSSHRILSGEEIAILFNVAPTQMHISPGMCIYVCVKRGGSM